MSRITITDPEHEQFKDSLVENGEFWADVVKRLKREKKHSDVLKICEQHIPLPAAFQDAAIALRRLRKDGDQPEEYVRHLYQLAVYHQFLYDTEKVTIRGGRSFFSYDVAEIAHRAGMRQDVIAEYDRIGSNDLSLLNKSDRRVIEDLWGETSDHRNPRVVYGHLWQHCVEEFEAKMRAMGL